MIGNRKASNEPPGRPFRKGRALGAAALSVLTLLLGIRYMQSTAAPPRPEPIVRPSLPGTARMPAQPQSPPPVDIVSGKRPPDPPATEGAGPKFAEERLPLEGASFRSTDRDPGPGPYMQTYGGRSGRLSPNASPHAVAEPIKNVSQGKGPKLIVWTASTRVSLGQPATIRAMVADDSGHFVKPDNITIAIASSGHAAEAAANPMPAAPPGDESQFVYAYVPPSGAAAGNPGRSPAPPTGTTASGPNAVGRIAPPQEYEFVVHATGNADGSPFEKVAGGFFLVQSAGAKLDPSSSAIEFVRGNLELSVGLKVDRSGTYLVSAELWAGADADKPLAFARQRLEGLPPGDQRVTLLFGGKVILDSGLDGPYVVRNVRLIQVDTIPPHDSDPIDELPKTRNWHATDFF